MCLAYNVRQSTADVDALFQPTAQVRDAAARAAARSGFPPEWLNDAVKGYLSGRANFAPFLELDHLKIMVTQPKYPLAMKCLVMRIRAEFHDLDDVRFLLRLLGYPLIRSGRRGGHNVLSAQPPPTEVARCTRGTSAKEPRGYSGLSRHRAGAAQIPGRVRLHLSKASSIPSLPTAPAGGSVGKNLLYASLRPAKSLGRASSTCTSTTSSSFAPAECRIPSRLRSACRVCSWIVEPAS
jgi:hypothetical protein